MKAKELFSKISSVKKKQLLSYGWDYDKMLELFKLDDEDTFMIPLQDPLNAEAAENYDSDSIDSTDSPTFDNTTSSDDFEDANDNTESSSNSDDSTDDPPSIPPRLPTNMNWAQNLEEHLHIPEVQDAVHNMTEDLRRFNRQHPVPLCVSMDHCAHAREPVRRSKRNVERPENYATFSRTGNKK